MRRFVVVVFATLLLAVPASARALEVGMSEQQAAAFADSRLRALDLPVARLIVPWDSAVSEPAAVQAWLDSVAAAGMSPHVAFEHLRSDRCPSSPCRLPTRSEYRAAAKRFIERFPAVRTYTTWNEANHVSQPTASSPETVAGYYDELLSLCPSCTIVSGDVVDSGSYTQWLRRFAAAAGSTPGLWGLHNYTDVTYGSSSGTDAALAAVPGNFWIEETGGIVVRRNSSGREILSSDEARAARAVSQAFTIAATRPRITRMYIYEWQAPARAAFDAGLVRPDGSARPSYSTLVSELARLRSASADATTARTSWTARWSRTRASTLVLRGRCLPAGSRCSGSVRARLRTVARGSHRVRTAVLPLRRYSNRSAVTLTLRVPRSVVARARGALRRSLALRVRERGVAARTVVLSLARPR